MSSLRNSNVYCSVYNCKTYYSDDKSISFHRFPKKKECNVVWINTNVVTEYIDRYRAWAIKWDKNTLKKTYDTFIQN